MKSDVYDGIDDTDDDDTDDDGTLPVVNWFICLMKSDVYDGYDDVTDADDDGANIEDVSSSDMSDIPNGS